MGLEPSKVVCIHLGGGEGRGSWQLSKLGQGLCAGSLFTPLDTACCLIQFQLMLALPN